MNKTAIDVVDPKSAPPENEFPMTVREAAKFLGVSPQTVYLWVERKQIPHLRVMGRISGFSGRTWALPRFLQTGDGEWQDHLNGMGLCINVRVEFWWICYRERNGKRRRESTFVRLATRPQEARDWLEARDGNVLQVVRRGETLNFGQWADFFLENYSKPPVRELKTHYANIRCIQHLKIAFGTRRLLDVTADDIELYLRERLRQRFKVRLRMATGKKAC